MHADRVRAVAAAYDRVADRWESSRSNLTGPLGRLLDVLLAPLPAGAAVLDVGCGHGVPVARHLCERRFHVTGLDVSARLLALAPRHVPGATFVHADMRTAALGATFDALVAWDSVFHVPRADHARVFRRFRRWLRPGGRLLLSLGGSAWEGTADMLGEIFFYSGHAPDESLRLLQEAGFDVFHSEIDDPSSRGHLVALATAT